MVEVVHNTIVRCGHVAEFAPRVTHEAMRHRVRVMPRSRAQSKVIAPRDRDGKDQIWWRACSCDDEVKLV